MFRLYNIFFILLTLSCSIENNNNPLIVGTSADNPPYEFISNGDIIGLDIDVINAIAKYLGRDIEIRNLDFYGLLAALASNNLDLVIAGLSVTPDREQYLDFSIPYVSTKVALLYRKADHLTDDKSIEKKVIGVQLGSVWKSIADDLVNSRSCKIVISPSNLFLVEKLKGKIIDAVILEETQCKNFILKNNQLSYFTLPNYSSKLAIAINKKSKMKNSIDKAIVTLKQSGVLSKIQKRWLDL